MAGLLGQKACQLLPDNAQQVKILPIQFARQSRATKHDQPDQAFKMEQRYQHPDRVFVDHPRRHHRGLARMVHAFAHLIEVNDESGAFQKSERARVHRTDRHFQRGPLPLRRQDQRATFAWHQQHAARAVGNIGDRLDHTCVQRLGIGVCTSDRARKAQPFGAIVIAMLKEMFGQHDIEPAPQPRRRHQRNDHDRRDKGKAQLDQLGRVATRPRDRLGRANHHDQINADNQQHERLKCHRTRWRQPQRPARTRCDPDHDHRHALRQRAQGDQFVGHHMAKIRYRIIIEVIAPQHGKREAVPPH